MTAPIYQWLSTDTAVAAIAGTRIYQTIAPQDVVKPYVTWNIVGGHSESYLSEGAGSDQQRIQVDVWALDGVGRKNLANAVRDALEPYGYPVGVPMDDYESDTKLFRMMLQFNFWTPH